MTLRVTMGVREIDLITDSLPRSMRRAISTSPSRVSSGTVPISRRYMRTGSLVLSSAPGVRSSSSSSAPSPVRSSSLSSRYFCSESTTSMPALPNVLNRSSSSSEDVMSAGRSSLTSSYSRYPFSLPMEMSCLTSSYFSSIDNGISPLAPRSDSQRPAPESGASASGALVHGFNLLFQSDLPRSELVDASIVAGDALFEQTGQLP